MGAFIVSGGLAERVAGGLCCLLDCGEESIFLRIFKGCACTRNTIRDSTGAVKVQQAARRASNQS